MKLKSKLLIIAGSDSSGGAGIQADIKTATSLGVYAMTAITAITAQNTKGVKSVIPIQPKEIFNQISYTVEDIKPNAIKIGMLHSIPVIQEVIKSIKKYKFKNIVLDPVMVSKSGIELISKNSIVHLKKHLIRFATLVTPNIPEAERLTGVKIFKLKDMVKAGKEILKLGAVYVLIKGGHMKGSKIQNILITKKLVKIFISKKIKTKHTHGTGCTLSSAIASYLSRGYSIEKACDSSINYVYKAIEQHPGFGKGHGPVNHVALLK